MLQKYSHLIFIVLHRKVFLTQYLSLKLEYFTNNVLKKQLKTANEEITLEKVMHICVNHLVFNEVYVVSNDMF